MRVAKRVKMPVMVKHTFGSLRVLRWTRGLERGVRVQGVLWRMRVRAPKGFPGFSDFWFSLFLDSCWLMSRSLYFARSWRSCLLRDDVGSDGAALIGYVSMVLKRVSTMKVDKNLIFLYDYNTNRLL